MSKQQILATLSKAEASAKDIEAIKALSDKVKDLKGALDKLQGINKSHLDVVQNKINNIKAD